MPVLELIIFAGLAAIVLYQLYAVLGRRVGRQPDEQAAAEAATLAGRAPDRLTDATDEGLELTGLAAVKSKDPAFDLAKFLAGAKQAYEMIVKAFAEGDKATLRPLLAPKILADFEAAIDARAAEGRTETVEFFHPPRADMEKAEVVQGDLAS